MAARFMIWRRAGQDALLVVISLSLLRAPYPVELRLRCKEGRACVRGAWRIQLGLLAEKHTGD